MWSDYMTALQALKSESRERRGMFREAFLVDIIAAVGIMVNDG